MKITKVILAHLVLLTAILHSAPLGADQRLSNPSLERLTQGNERFVSGRPRNDGQSMKDIQRLSKAQSPRAIILSCSDSRVPPELIFDQKLGEMFTIRVAGEALSSSVLASIEYAVQNLGSELLVVLGHTHCGAIKATVEKSKAKTTGSKNLDELIADIEPRIAGIPQNKLASGELREESWANAKGIAKDLITRSKIIENAVQAQTLEILTGLYDLDNGHVEFDTNSAVEKK